MKSPVLFVMVKGLPCDWKTSSCNGWTQLCRASGPGKDMFESTEIIGRKQFEMALTIFGSDAKKKKNSLPTNTMHMRLGHASETKIRATVKKMDIQLFGKMEVCTSCAEGKAQQKKLNKESEGATEKGERIFGSQHNQKEKLWK